MCPTESWSPTLQDDQCDVTWSYTQLLSIGVGVSATGGCTWFLIQKMCLQLIRKHKYGADHGGEAELPQTAVFWLVRKIAIIMASSVHHPAVLAPANTVGAVARLSPLCHENCWHVSAWPMGAFALFVLTFNSHCKA